MPEFSWETIKKMVENITSTVCADSGKRPQSNFVNILNGSLKIISHNKFKLTIPSSGLPKAALWVPSTLRAPAAAEVKRWAPYLSVSGGSE